MKTPKEPTPHNPDGVTVEQLNPTKRGKPWRLLDEDEIGVRGRQFKEIESYGLGGEWIMGCYGASDSVTYRTRLTRAQLSKLTKGGAK